MTAGRGIIKKNMNKDIKDFCDKAIKTITPIYHKDENDKAIAYIMDLLIDIKRKVEYEGLEYYIQQLPYLGYDNGKFVVADNDFAYAPTLYKFEGKWGVDWVHSDDGDSIKYILGETPEEAVKNAYDWCVEEGYIKIPLTDSICYGK